MKITKFRAGKIPIRPFKCYAAVYGANGQGSSLCYCTSIERAKWIAERINLIVEIENKLQKD